MVEAIGTKENPIHLGTSHLPAEVVGQDVHIVIKNNTQPDNPRLGQGTVGLRLGGRDKPELSEDELVYIDHILDWAKDYIRRNF